MHETLLPREFPGGRLRRLRPADREAFQAYRAIPELGRYQGWSPMSEAEALEFLVQMNQTPLFTRAAWVQLGIAELQSDALVGDIGLYLSADASTAEVGFTLRPSLQGRGLAGRAVREALGLLFAATEVTHVVGITDERNLASIRLLERLGFKYRETRDVVFRGAPCAENVYALSRTDGQPLAGLRPRAAQASPLPAVERLVAKLKDRGITLPPGPVHADGYGDSPELSASLLELIRSGRKRAGTGLLWAYEHDGGHIASVGDIEIVVDHLHEPAIVSRIVSSEVVPFARVTAEYAAIEGEGDGSLDHWRQAHWSYFSRECRRIGRVPDESMPVICCVFEVLHVVPSSCAARDTDVNDPSPALQSNCKV
jgi:RimJ/RimL family protein N-acetyltransferase/uncharacterized protein YhfF